MYNYIPLEQAADILDSYRKPVNSKERLILIKGKPWMNFSHIMVRRGKLDGLTPF